MEHYKIITIDMTQIDEEQKQMLKDLPGAISERTTTLHQDPTKGKVELNNALEEVNLDVEKYENAVEDEKLDHVKGDME